MNVEVMVMKWKIVVIEDDFRIGAPSDTNPLSSILLEKCRFYAPGARKQKTFSARLKCMFKGSGHYGNQSQYVRGKTRGFGILFQGWYD